MTYEECDALVSAYRNAVLLACELEGRDVECRAREMADELGCFIASLIHKAVER